MKVFDILNSPWAILPEKLQEISDVYRRHLAGDKASLAEFEVQLAQAAGDDEDEKCYIVEDGVAIVPVVGVLAKRMNMFMKFSGGTSTQLLQRDFQSAMEDPAVKSILLVVDSPGGTVDGTQNLAETIRASRGKGKPIYALADGLMASAAYWIGSAADKVFLSSGTTHVGSIGVIATHTDYSKQDEMNGVKTTDITAGSYKAIASENTPLSEEGRAYMQDIVDAIYKVFVDDVAANRGVSPKDVLKEMADGRIFMGDEGVKRGLADGIMSMDSVLEKLRQDQEDDEDEDGLTASPIMASATEGIMEVKTVSEPEVVSVSSTEYPPANSTVSSTNGAVVISPPEPAGKGEDVEAGAEDEAKVASQPGAKRSEEGIDPMWEEKIRKLFKLDAEANIEEALLALAKTRDEVISGDGEATVVPLFDHMLLKQEKAELEQKIAELKAEAVQKDQDHAKELRRREAKVRVDRALAECKLTPAMVKAWGEQMAFESPSQFDAVLASMPKLYKTKGEGSDAGSIIVGAIEQFGQAVSQKAEEFKKAGKQVPKKAELHRMVAESDPDLYQAVLEESRDKTRGKE